MDDVIWSCPDCDGDLERDSYGLWCPACEQVVPYACLPADPDDWYNDEGARLAERNTYIGTWSHQDVTKRGNDDF